MHNLLKVHHMNVGTHMCTNTHIQRRIGFIPTLLSHIHEHAYHLSNTHIKRFWMCNYFMRFMHTHAPPTRGEHRMGLCSKFPIRIKQTQFFWDLSSIIWTIGLVGFKFDGSQIRSGGSKRFRPRFRYDELMRYLYSPLL